MRFKMRFEGDEAPERRLSGTIVGVNKKASSQWEDSEWRLLKVQWDEQLSVALPERVSPWELEPLVAAIPPVSRPFQRIKRARPPVLLPVSSDVSSASGAWKSPSQTTQMFSFSASQRVSELYSPSTPITVFSPISNPNSVGLETKNSPTVASSRMGWPVRPETQSDALSVSSNKDSCDRRQETHKGCRLFGIQLIEGRGVEVTSLVVPTVTGVGADQAMTSLEVDSEQQSQPSADQSGTPAGTSEIDKLCLRETQTRQLRSCTKVHMQGMAVGRAVDLTRLSGYSELLQKLEGMFNIKGELTSALKKWVVVYTDDEDDTMMVGDDPWLEFCNMVRKVNIYTSEEAKRLSPKKKLPVMAEAVKLGSKISLHDADVDADVDADQDNLGSGGTGDGA